MKDTKWAFKLAKTVAMPAVVLLLMLMAATPLIAGGTPEPTTAEDTTLYETPDDPRLFQPGKLTVSTGEPVYPPWMLNDDPASGEGFENAMVYALAAEMGFARSDVQWVR